MYHTNLDSGILILYGSESGTAQDLAEHVWQILSDSYPMSRCISFDDYQIKQELDTEAIVIFIVATAGQGEVPTNMRKNWRYLLSRNLGPSSLSDLQFAVLALGDSSYTKFNFTGKKLYRRLQQLGATPILELALADEQHKLGIDEVFEKWLPDLVLCIAKLKKNINVSPTSQSALQTRHNFLIEFYPSCLPDSSKYFPLKIVANERLTDEYHFQETRLITFSTEEFDSHFQYSSGDVLMVLPENLPESIESSISVLKSCANFLDTSLHICRANNNVPFHPQYIRFFNSAAITLRHCLHFYFDLHSIPKRRLLRQLATFSLDQIERDRLFELSSEEGMEDYLDYCHRSKRTLSELLRDFPKTSADLKPQQIFDFFPIIRPRAFSIASSPQAHAGKIQILVARVEYKIRRMSGPRMGLCSNFICSSSIGSKVYVRIRPGLFKHRCGEQLILVGPGTGIAPLRSIIIENEINRSGCSILLFFGCRNAEKDFYFKDEWPRYKKTKIVTAFSRDQKEKIYVQHKIIENAKDVWGILKNNGKILIAGSSGEMPRAVVNAFKVVVSKMGDIADAEAEELIEKMERNGQIVYETWS